MLSNRGEKWLKKHEKVGAYLITLFIILVLQGCSRPYFGYSEAAWQAMSEEEKVAITTEYQAVIDARGEQAHADVIDARTQSVIDRGVNGPKYGPR